MLLTAATLVVLIASLWLLAHRAIAACEAANVADWGGRWRNRLDGLNRLFCARYHHFRDDLISLPEEGPALLASNHVSGLDPLLLIAASRRPLRFMMAREEYERFGLTWLFRMAGCIPVDRGGRPELAFREALRALHNGEVVALFPHGKIHLDRDPPRKLKAGVVKLAELSGAPICPVRLEGIRGEGLAVRAVFMRSRPRLRSFAPMDCTGLPPDQCLEALAALLEGRGTRDGGTRD